MLKITKQVITSKPNIDIKFPNKLKGTILEKWTNYWKNLFIDYKQMLQDLRTDIQDNPKKAFKWTLSISTLYLLAKNNPSEIDFNNEVRKITNEVILLSEECRNPKSLEHLRYLQICNNEGVIKYKNLGIFSVMFYSDFSDNCSLYKSQCSYLQPSYLNYPLKVLDVGFMGRWWNLYIKTTDYDVNIK